MISWPAALGVALGMRHALEPDHLAAVSTFASEGRSTRSGLALGASWGIGHAGSLFVVGGALALLEAQLPVRLEQFFELVVALVVLVLGARAVRRAVLEGRSGPTVPHTHGGQQHVHPAPPSHLHLERLTLSTRPLLVGALHGLAGSGALAALVLARLPDVAARLQWVALFGLGSALGMAALTGLAGVLLARLSRRPRVAAGLLAITGALSMGIGAWWGVAAASHLWS